ncbi:MAG: trypsin-like peptidase domain-containing protein [candidate division Zixibacteria bacterium]|nr:trypsin-like peptidase domain-containing protein [candidate division Zixibacteria bacterium]
MKSVFSSPNKKKNSRGQNWKGYFSVAVVFTVIGILIASNFDLTPEVNALNSSQFSAYPVVERNGEYESPFVATVEKVSDAVVNISAQSEVTKPYWLHRSRGPSFSTSSGSGFFFRKDGYILTNNHVIKGADNLIVTTSSGYQYEATLVGTDPQTDLAVIKVNPDEEVTIISFGHSNEIKVGDWAIAIGNPFPQQGLDRTVTVGVISAKGRSNLNFGQETPLYQNYIQTDASINPGNSGGPLLNLKGECIGVNSAISSPTGASVGIGFAIPINMARSIVPDLIESGEVNRAWLGVWLNNVTENEAKRQGLDAVRGVKIDSVFQNSPADLAGIKSGDIILNFNEQDIKDSDELRVLVATLESGSDVPVEIVRDGERLHFNTSVADRKAMERIVNNTVQPDEPEDFNIYEWMGMEIMNYTPEIAQIIGGEFVSGVFVRRVYRNSPASIASVVRGTVILQINDELVSKLEDLEKIVGKIRNPKRRISLIVQEPDGTIARKVIKKN